MDFTKCFHNFQENQKNRQYFQPIVEVGDIKQYIFSKTLF